MKNLFVVAMLGLLSLAGYSQDVRKPSEGKALVYFVRPSGMGALINFKYFDGEKYLGKFNAGSYLAHECEPGAHIFWTKSENMDFVEAELEAGKVYIIEAEPTMGAFKAAVQLHPLNKKDKKYEKKRKRILKAIRNDQEYKFNGEKDPEEDYADVVARGMERFKKRKEKGEEFEKLTADMDFDPAEEFDVK